MSPRERPTIALTAIAVVASMALAACGDAEPDTITLVAYESFPTDPASPVVVALEEFTADTGIDVDIIIAGDTGTMLSKAVLTAGNPEGDVMWGVDNTFLSRALDAEVFEPYVAEGVETLPAEFTDLVPDGAATPVDFGDVCVNYDIAALEEMGLAPPTSLADLAEPEYAGLLVVENPATSSPGLAFLLATIAEFGDADDADDGGGGWEAWWEAMRANDVLIVDGWTQAYYEAFSLWGGDRPLTVSYGSSPPFEVLYTEEPLSAAPSAVIDATCFRQVEFAGVLAGTDAPDAARQLVDFLVSERFQREVALNLFVFPVNPGVELEPEFVEHATIPDNPLRIDPDLIDEHRADWIDRWTSIVTG